MILSYPIKNCVASMSREYPFINIRESVIKKAIKNGDYLRVWKTAVIDPKVWLATGYPREQVFLRPDKPLKLIGNYVNEKTIVKIPQKNRDEEILKMALL